MKQLMRLSAIALVLFSLACTVLQTGKRIYAPGPDESEAPRGLELSVVSVSRGTAVLELRNYSLEPFVYYGAPERPRLEIETEALDGRISRHKFSYWSTKQSEHEVPPGERMKFEASVLNNGFTSRIRFGIRSHNFGYVVWTPPIPLS